MSVTPKVAIEQVSDDDAAAQAAAREELADALLGVEADTIEEADDFPPAAALHSATVLPPGQSSLKFGKAKASAKASDEAPPPPPTKASDPKAPPPAPPKASPGKAPTLPPVPKKKAAKNATPAKPAGKEPPTKKRKVRTRQQVS